MTTKELKEALADIPDDVEVYMDDGFSVNAIPTDYAGDNFPIGTMNPIGEDKIEFCSNNYGENPILGCLRVMAFLKQKEQ